MLHMTDVSILAESVILSYCILICTAYSFGKNVFKNSVPSKKLPRHEKKIIGFLYDRYYLVVSKNRGKTPKMDGDNNENPIV